jgi:hypothetical protein
LGGLGIVDHHCRFLTLSKLLLEQISANVGKEHQSGDSRSGGNRIQDLYQHVILFEQLLDQEGGESGDANRKRPTHQAKLERREGEKCEGEPGKREYRGKRPAEDRPAAKAAQVSRWRGHVEQRPDAALFFANLTVFFFQSNDRALIGKLDMPPLVIANALRICD